MRKRVQMPEDANQEVAFFKRTASEAWPHLSPSQFRESLGADHPPSYYAGACGDKVVMWACGVGMLVVVILLVSGNL
jgi:hypothetical protein